MHQGGAGKWLLGLLDDLNSMEFLPWDRVMLRQGHNNHHELLLAPLRELAVSMGFRYRALSVEQRRRLVRVIVTHRGGNTRSSLGECAGSRNSSGLSCAEVHDCSHCWTNTTRSSASSQSSTSTHHECLRPKHKPHLHSGSATFSSLGLPPTGRMPPSKILDATLKFLSSSTTRRLTPIKMPVRPPRARSE